MTGCSPAWQLLFSWPPGLAQLPSLPLGVGVSPPLFLMTSTARLSLETSSCCTALCSWGANPHASQPCPTWTCRAWRGALGSSASACSCAWSPCSPCWGPWPWGSAEPWLPLPSGCCGGRPAPSDRLHQMSWVVLRDVLKLYNLS